mgnify:CR=1 FL=1
MSNFYRGRRTRGSEKIRRLARETELSPRDAIAPIFVIEGANTRQKIESMPGVERVTVDLLPREIEALHAKGVRNVILFGLPARKDSKGTSAHEKGNVVERAIRAAKDAVPDMALIADVCLCAYTDHGHCGHLTPEGDVDNDATLETLAKAALSYAQAGVDVVAPSDMMDGRVRAIRTALDAQGFAQTPILSYAAKYASAFYGPFREAAASSPKKGDRKSYQMDAANGRQAMREIAEDIREGADFVMVKPAIAYLDIIRAASKRFDTPVFAYQVSGEYSMIQAMAKLGWGEERALALESLTAIKRAGAKKILTYFAAKIQDWVQ